MYKVKFMKYFVNGHLKGLSYDSIMTFDSLDSATHYMGFLLKHTLKPIRAIGNSDYTCHVIRMER